MGEDLGDLRRAPSRKWWESLAFWRRQKEESCLVSRAN